MRARSTLGGIAATALLAVGGGVGTATAQSATPDTGATACNSGDPREHVVQQTKYHGIICYANVGYDDLTSSGFWTTYVSPGCNDGYVTFIGVDGTPTTEDFYANGPAVNLTGYTSSHVMAVIGIGISAVRC